MRIAPITYAPRFSGFFGDAWRNFLADEPPLDPTKQPRELPTSGSEPLFIAAVNRWISNGPNDYITPQDLYVYASSCDPEHEGIVELKEKMRSDKTIPEVIRQFFIEELEPQLGTGLGMHAYI